MNVTSAPILAGRTIGEDDGSFVIAEWTDDGGGFDPPQYIAPKHLHRTEDEAWYVLEGQLNVLVGDETVNVRSGACVMVPKGTVHTYWNPASAPCRYLLIMGPKTYQLIGQIHAKQRTWPEVVALFEEYEAEIAEG